MRMIQLSLTALALVVGCGTAPGPPDPALLIAWEEELMAADRAFNEATSKNRAAGWVSFFAEDGAMISAGMGEIRGTDAIRATMQEAFGDSTFELSWEPNRAAVSAAGDLGYTVGRYTSVRGADPDHQTRSSGLYVSIWRKQEDGSWKVEMDLGNPTSS
jgi:ketosteroid isomerase-like protein